MEGHWRALKERRLHKDWRVWAGVAFLPFAWFYVLTAPPPLPSFAEAHAQFQPSEAWLYDRNHVLLEEVRVSYTARRLGWVPLGQIAPVLVQDVITAEDRRFYSHGGVDYWALLRAAWARRAGGHSQGASTLSMQVAGFLAPDLARPGKRRWVDKIRQIRAAWALESGWSKQDILEAYFNLAGYRGEAQGIAAASQDLFGKAPDAISPQEARLITALLPSPQANASEIAARACRADPPNCAALTHGAAQMVSHAGEHGIGPGLAPHLASRLLQKPGMQVTSALDSAIQLAATQALRHQLRALGGTRARDGAVVVLDNASGDVLAYVGGAGDASTASAVDGANAPRQAGSTLKPFLYGMVFEKGWLTAASILQDSPVALDTASGLYVPQNYDHAFKGPVSARTALAGSLNVPAVRTLMVAGVEPFRDRLWDLGYHGLVEAGSYYGYSLALGSAEVTLLEQANAYRTLANGGRRSALRLTLAGLKDPEPQAKPRNVMSPQSAWLVGDILADPSARIVTFGPDSALRLPFWAAAKTGTSKAMRDNWCVGYTDRYTVAVWIGNLEGDSMKSVSGTSGAAPVWHDVMLALHAQHPGKAPARPDGLELVQVRFASGIEANRREWFLKGTSQAFSDMVPQAARRPRIVSPVSGSVFALDPDIPFDRQRFGVRVVGAGPEVRLLLDKRDIGPALANPLIFPSPGVHQLALVDGTGKAVYKVQYSVR